MKPIAVSLCLLTLVAPASAGTASDAEASAKALDSEAVRLRAEKKPPSEYCPKFTASEALSPTVQRKLKVAECLVFDGKMASAFAKYKEATLMADANVRANAADKIASEQYEFAHNKMTEIEPKLPKLTIVVTEKVPGLTVVRGADVIADAVFGIAIPIDAGTYSVTAKAPGYKTVSVSVQVTESGAQVVTIPKLESVCADGAPYAAGECAPSCASGQSYDANAKACVAIATAPTTPPPAASTTSTWVPPPPPEKSHDAPVLTWVLGGTGVALIGVGVVTSIVGKDKWASSQADCTASTLTCSPAGHSLQSQALTMGNVATVTFIAGGVLVVAGAAIWLFGGSSDSAPRAGLAVTPGGMSVVGNF